MTCPVIMLVDLAEKVEKGALGWREEQAVRAAKSFCAMLLSALALHSAEAATIKWCSADA